MNGMMEGMMSTMMIGGGIVGLLMLVALVLLIAALAKYLYSGPRH